VSDEKRPPTAIPLKILEGGFTLVPAFWAKLMGVVAEFDRATGERIPTPTYDKHIPASFWKYSFVLWRDIVGPNCQQKRYTAKKTMQDFGIRPATASRWTAAYTASGLFEVKLGARHVKGAKGDPSVYRYLDSTEYEWEVFLRCLSGLCARDKHDSNSQEGSEGSIAAFRAELTWLIAVTKKEDGFQPSLSKENRAYLDECLKNGIARTVASANMLERIEFARTPTNRLGVLPKDKQIDYWGVDVSDGQSVVAAVRNSSSRGRANLFETVPASS
jgi:hypothetical protein